jgi:hypothetical protein
MFNFLSEDENKMLRQEVEKIKKIKETFIKNLPKD